MKKSVVATTLCESAPLTPTESTMKLETAPVGEDSGIAQIQAQLAAMALELRDMKKAKTSREEVWCMQC